ncbi:diguanylate cyclase [Thermanaerosceptrum fracticalcis]|uniref:Diguanylate cyclase n=2 Tax=Thermanaerosceptrum fracticalcis TaxID=1712410 RepID=A0A7G6E5X9_THEFR|nr:diguanylate cyclase [Thermanaerosceptrum fracticalcis]
MGAFRKSQDLFCRKLGSFLKYFLSYYFLFISTNCITPVLVMPVIVRSIQAGLKEGFLWASISTLGLLITTIIDSSYLEIDIMVTGIIWLLAWLLGKMSDTETQIREELQNLAYLDGLTGIYNHRSFHSILDEQLLRAKIENKSLALLMLDVDYFKYYNDAYGHQKGDEVLRTIAKLIEENTKHIGFCARYGGEEFSVIIPDCNKECGLEIGELIRQAVEKTDFKGANILPKGRLTVSVGVVCFPESADSKEQLIQKADEAMYKAKYTSKNKVELYYSVLDEMSHSLQDKEKDLLNSLRTLLMVVNAKDRYTYGHSERVMHYASQIGTRLALWEWEIQELTVGALLHDIGKIEISREVLNKPGKLTPEEWEAVKQHPMWGADMIRPISSLGGAVDIVLYHHENFDGSGYPNALKGEEIPLGARILRVVDSFDAMTTNRPYKDALSMKQALEELNKYKGIHYDPEVVEVFTRYIIDTGIIAEKALN